MKPEPVETTVLQANSLSFRAYIPALKIAVIVQGIVLVLAALILDMEQARHISMVAALADWLMIGLIMLRRPYSPTRLDLLAIKWGYLPLLIIVGSVGPRFFWPHFW
jgi:hypothetical protein